MEAAEVLTGVRAAFQDQGPEECVCKAVLCPDFCSSVSTAGLLDQELMSEVAAQRSFSFIATGFDFFWEVKENWIKANF